MGPSALWNCCRDRRPGSPVVAPLRRERPEEVIAHPQAAVAVLLGLLAEVAQQLDIEPGAELRHAQADPGLMRHGSYPTDAHRGGAILHFADIYEAIADAVPDAPAISQGSRIVRWSEYDDGAARLAAALADHGLGHGSKVGMFMYNSPEYLITQYAAFKERMTPINVNYRYLDDELTYLLDNADCEAVVYHRSLSDRLARIRDRLPQLRWYVVVDDGAAPGGAEVDGAEAFDDGRSRSIRRRLAVAAPRDDLYMLYTGGTTGMPKGVMYEMGPFTENFLGFVAAGMGRAPFTSEAEMAEVVAGLVASGAQPKVIPACPLMHGTGMWLGSLMPQLSGSEVALLEGRSFDAHELWQVVERRGVNSLVIVGDAFGRPMLQALRDRDARRCRLRRQLGQRLHLLRRDALDVRSSTGCSSSRRAHWWSTRWGRPKAGWPRSCR